MSTVGWYAVTEDAFDTDVSFKWNENVLEGSEQTVTEASVDDYYDMGSSEDDSTGSSNLPQHMHVSLKWRNEPQEVWDEVSQRLSLTIQHPTFEKDVLIKGHYRRNQLDLFRLEFDAEYCSDPEHYVTFEACLQDLTEQMGYRHFAYRLNGNHDVSKVYLRANGSVSIRPGLFETTSLGGYKQGYLPLQEGSLIGIVNARTQEVLYAVSDFLKSIQT